jgi:Trypsin
MRIAFIIITQVVFSLAPGAMAQNAADTANLARTLSEISGVPIGTALTDLVTKGSTAAITSSLQRPVEGQAAASASAEVQLTRKGFALREVELDTRFEANVKRIIGQVSLDALTTISTANTGITVPPVSSSRNTIGWFGGIMSLPDVETRRMQLPGDIGIGGIGPTVPQPPPGGLGSSLRTATPAAERSNERVWGGSAIMDDADMFRDSVAVIGNNEICSGALVGPDLVVTAAHCFCRGIMDDVIVGTSIISSSRFKVLKDQSKVFQPCDQIRTNPGVGDVALLKLERPTGQAPKPLAPLSMIKGSAAVRAVGFGRTSQTIGFKYQVNIAIASHQCDGAGVLGLPDSQVYQCKSLHELVAAGLNKDTCGGDSGGGVYVFGDDNVVYLAAVTSRAIHPKGDCGRGGIYTLLTVSPIREWMEEAGVRIPQ